MNEKIHQYQYVFLLILYGCANLFLIDAMLEQGHTQIWVSFLLALVPGLLIGLLQGGLMRFGKADWGDLLQKVYGVPLGKFLNLLYVLFFLVSGAVVLNYDSLHLVDQMLERQEMLHFALPVALAAIYAGGKGLKTAGRIAAVLGIPILFVLAICIAQFFLQGEFVSSGLVWNAAWPGEAAIIAALQYGQLFCVILFFNRTDHERHALGKTLLGSFLGNGIVLILAVAMEFLQGGNAFSGIGILMICAYFIVAAFQILMHLFAAGHCLGTLFSLKKEGALALPLGIVLLAGAILLSFSPWLTGKFMLEIYPWISAGMMIFLPLATFLFCIIKKEKRKKACGFR